MESKLIRPAVGPWDLLRTCLGSISPPSPLKGYPCRGSSPSKTADVEKQLLFEGAVVTDLSHPAKSPSGYEAHEGVLKSGVAAADAAVAEGVWGGAVVNDLSHSVDP